MMYYIYILLCIDNTYYTGFTTDVQKRLIEHNAGKGAKYTRGRTPCKLVYTEIFKDKGSAMKREWYIKHKLTRKEKEELINRFTK
ncbi:MAG: GIY-YIG nuclease family protein [Catonella sp.]|uniref:GIY-YIG nuclease family protein n=1 Tax=Catonella sp. TaxID=2382125 RepID=UPI003F9FE28F